MRQGFAGWYLKHQKDDTALALIPGRARDGVFIQAITASQSFQIPFPNESYQFGKGILARIGANVFSKDGISLDIRRPGFELRGEIAYADLTVPRSDVMGPFRFFPMECRHHLVSLHHTLHGAVILNGETLHFDGGTGYIEGDSGVSFPETYAWVQCGDFQEACCVMASAAKIPFAGFHFWGCIAVVWLGGQEYRLATYRGAKIRRLDRTGIEITQGSLSLSITVAPRSGQLLRAPVGGSMSRDVRESLCVPARFCFMKDRKTLFEAESRYASCEFSL